MIVQRLGVLACALLLAACGGPGSVNASESETVSSGHTSEWDLTGMPDPCRLIHQSDVSTAVGRPASTGRKVESWPPLCQFALGNGTQFYLSDNEKDTARQEFDQLRNSGQAIEPVTGLGRDAYWVPQMRTLHVLTGKVHLAVAFAGPGLPSSPAARAATEKVARLAVARV